MHNIIHTTNHKPLYIIYSTIIISILSLSTLALTTIISSSPTHASPVNFSVSIAPSLNVTIPTNIISLNLNPVNNAFSTSDLTVSVGTNNPSGYTLIMTSNSTDLTRTEKVGDTYPVISTLTSETTESNFTTNRWGYRFNDNTANTNYQPFTTNILVKEYDKAVNNDTRTITFASKVDTTQAPGTYELALNFTAVANPIPVSSIQDLTLDQCRVNVGTNGNSANVGDSLPVYDKRDNKQYTVRYINGACWMTQNLRYLGDTGSASGEMTIKSATTNFNTDKTLTYYDLKNDASSSSSHCYGYWNSSSDWGGDGYTNLCIAEGLDNENNPTVWYNYAAATIGTIYGTLSSTGTSSNTAQYSVCPAGWTLPANGTSAGQINNVTSYKDAFSPVHGGYYNNGQLSNESLRGRWWSTTKNAVNSRYYLYYGNVAMNTGSGSRSYGYYVRCVRTS